MKKSLRELIMKKIFEDTYTVVASTITKTLTDITPIKKWKNY